MIKQLTLTWCGEDMVLEQPCVQIAIVTACERNQATGSLT